MQSGPRFDALITDHMMPGISGVELIAWARERQPGLPVLLLTGYTDSIEGLPPDIPLLHKPCERDALLQTIQAVTVSGAPAEG